MLTFVSSLLVLAYTIWREKSKARLEEAQAFNIESKTAAEADEIESRMNTARAAVIDKVNENALNTIKRFDERLDCMEASYEKRLSLSEKHYQELWARLTETEEELLRERKLRKESNEHYEEQICKLRQLISDMQVKIKFMETERNELIRQKEDAVSLAKYWKEVADANPARS